MVSSTTKFSLNKRVLGLHLLSVMLSSSRKNPLNKSVLFEINPKSVSSNDENFDENYVSTSQKKLLPLAGISAKILENVFNGQ